MKAEFIPPVCDGLVNVIIETPKFSGNKYVYDPKMDLFRLKKPLPLGMVFPFDFGFVPNTKADDGDPLDVLVIMEQQAYPGCLVPCRAIGVLEAEQAEKGKRKSRNDRIIAIAEASILYAGITRIKELNENITTEIENFFIDYNRHEGKTFAPMRWSSGRAAHHVIATHSTMTEPQED